MEFILVSKCLDRKQPPHALSVVDSDLIGIAQHNLAEITVVRDYTLLFCLNWICVLIVTSLTLSSVSIIGGSSGYGM